jgi:peptidoglycan DL-endopeptidase CwlO
VATPRSLSWMLRPLTALALAAATLGAFPATGDAAPHPAAAPRPATPQTAAEARTQLAELGEQGEKVAELYNDARVAYKKRLKESRAADKQARAAQAQYAVLAGQVKQVVSSAYKNVPFGQFTTLLTSGSPREFIDQLSTLGLLADRRGALLNRIAGVRAAALKAQAKAQTAVAAAQKTQREIAARKADLAKREQVLRGLLSRFTASERAALLAPDDRASRSAPRGPISVGPASGAARKAAQVALDQLGDCYSWGAAGPSCFDCSGLTMYAYAAAGINLPHSSAAQSTMGSAVSRSAVRAGDLVTYYLPVHHVGIAIDGNRIVHAPTYGQPVTIASIDHAPVNSIRRVA